MKQKPFYELMLDIEKNQAEQQKINDQILQKQAEQMMIAENQELQLAEIQLQQELTNCRMELAEMTTTTSETQ